MASLVHKEQRSELDKNDSDFPGVISQIGQFAYITNYTLRHFQNSVGIPSGYCLVSWQTHQYIYNISVCVCVCVCVGGL